MQKKFTVELLSFKKIAIIENSWNQEDYKALLEMMGIEEEDLKGMPIEELREMCKMSLSDFEAHESANFLMHHIFKDAVTDGKIDQLCHQMAEEKMWELYPDLSFHQALFKSYALLREAYNGIFPKPTGVQLRVKITAASTEDLSLFDDSLYPSLVRLLASGMSSDAILNRLYEDQLRGTNFLDAENILWDLKELSRDGLTLEYELISSEFWLLGLEDVETFEAHTHPDIPSSDAEED